jgi:hypothetical protein
MIPRFSSSAFKKLSANRSSEDKSRPNFHKTKVNTIATPATISSTRKGAKATREAIIKRITSSNNKMIKIPEPSVPLQSIVRLPKIWKFEADREEYPSEQAKTFFLKRKGHMQAGDIIMPTEFYRGDGTFIVGENKKLESPIMFVNGEIMLPPWVFEKGMQNGFTFEQLKAIYDNVYSLSLVVYPFALQGSSLKHLKSGVITSLRTYEPTSGIDVSFKKGEDHYDDLSKSLRMSTLFPNATM